MSSLTVLQLVKTNPAPLVDEVLSEQLFQALRLKNPTPVLFQSLLSEDIAGYCSPRDYTSHEEVVVSDALLKIEKSWRDMKRGLVYTYIHEISHRLTAKVGRDPGPGHDAVFAAINFALLTRASAIEGHERQWMHLQIYDLQDHLHADVRLGDAMTFAVDVGFELAQSELTAEQIAVEAARQWEAYKKAVLERPAKETFAKAELQQLRVALNDERESRSTYYTRGFCLGLLAFVVLYFTIHTWR